ncbi:MAG: glycosyltransferase [Limisphaerales bacterium]
MHGVTRPTSTDIKPWRLIKTTNLIFSVSRNAGGIFESVRRLVQSQTAHRVNARVLGGRDEFTDADLAAWHPVPVQAFAPTGLRQFGYSPRFLEELWDFKPDILHSHGLWVYPSMATNSYCSKSHQPYVVSAHGMLDPWAMRNSRWKKAIAYFLFEGSHLRRARCLHALCESEARAMRELKLKNAIAIIPNGIDLPESREQKAESRNPPWHGIIEPGRKVLLFLSRIHPKKGLVNLLKAWAEVRRSELRGQRSGEWVLAIAGWDQGGHEAELKKLATELGLAWADVRKQKAESGNESQLSASQHFSVSDFHLPFQVSAFQISSFSVLFLGPQFGAAKDACYANCDAFVLPSVSEGLPMVILEAWAYGKPVIMTLECNLPEGFSARAALKIGSNSESMATGLSEFLRMTDTERAEMGRRGHVLAADRFAWPKIGAQMKEVYEWMLGGGPKPGCVT